MLNMMQIRLRDIFSKPSYKLDPMTFEVEDVEDVTDEIELALLELKDSFDLPTEEVEVALLTRRAAIKNREK